MAGGEEPMEPTHKSTERIYIDPMVKTSRVDEQSNGSRNWREHNAPSIWDDWSKVFAKIDKLVPNQDMQNMPQISQLNSLGFSW